MFRRSLLLLAMVASIAIGACSPPAAPALTDPKDILTKSVLALKDIKTIQIDAQFEGTISAAGTGNLDLKGTTLELDADIAGKKGHVVLNAAGIMGTTAEAFFSETSLIYKLGGPLAMMVPSDPSGKFTKIAVPASSGSPVDVAKDPQKAIDDFKAQLDKLPNAPTKAANEKCGDQDCYHITLSLTDQDVKAMDPTADVGAPFSVAIDIFSRTNDLRPARLVIKLDAGTTGTVSMFLTMTYDGSLSITEPSADQVVTP